MSNKKEGMKAYYGITFLIGLGFFTMGLMDPLYDTYVPMFLSNFLSSDSLVGGIMGLDNFFAILLIPVVSAISDRTKTPIGRRMPYIITMLPATAILFSMLPGAALKSLAFLIICIFFLNLFKQSVRGPVVALMPDIIPGEYRSEANGVINTMGGIAAIVGTVGLAKLYDVKVRIPLFGDSIVPFAAADTGSETTYIGKLPFVISAVLVIIAVILLFFFVKEKKNPEGSEEKSPPVFQSLKLIFTSSDKSAFFILLSLLCWFIAYQGVLPWVGIYSKEFLQLSPGNAALSAGMVGIAYAIFAIPSGIVAHKIGRKKVIRFSLILVGIVLVLCFLHYPVTSAMGISGSARYLSFWALLFLFGIFWVSIVTNSFPMLWQMATYSDMGIYTGLYYFFSQAAGIIAPILTGALRDLFGDRAIFINGAFFMLVAFILMSFVTKGEPEKKTV
ncbi:MAG: MFS transporter [Spirochaetales bacterium]|uniref:MFS transporter n=1 Tax=Candidatus Thalassospirochaeta sargassi TaxID=3119039 RepID=A0AAJ1MKL7_9SPIO|nr:MFS transporter [Spirochaetales bacterium]